MCFSSCSAFVLGRSEEQRLKEQGGRGKKKCVGGVTNLRRSGSIQGDLSIVLLLLFACHSLADFFTLVKAL